VVKLVLGLISLNQIPQKIQHVFPAAVPHWRSLLSVLAAILVGLALRSPKKTMITFFYDAADPGLGPLGFCALPEIRLGVSQGANIAHPLDPSSS